MVSGQLTPLRQAVCGDPCMEALVATGGGGLFWSVSCTGAAACTAVSGNRTGNPIYAVTLLGNSDDAGTSAGTAFQRSVRLSSDRPMSQWFGATSCQSAWPRRQPRTETGPRASRRMYQGCLARETPQLPGYIHVHSTWSLATRDTYPCPNRAVQP